MAGLAIRARGLTRQFSSVRALDDLNLEVPAGSVFGFLGPNGAGKTTTIRLLLGPPLVGSAVAAAGVFVSLHAATVRQAQQTLGIVLAVVVVGGTFGIGALPAAWKARLMQMLFGWPLTELVLLGAGVILALDLALVFAAMARFQRSKLVLD